MYDCIVGNLEVSIIWVFTKFDQFFSVFINHCSNVISWYNFTLMASISWPVRGKRPNVMGREVVEMSVAAVLEEEVEEGVDCICSRLSRTKAERRGKGKTRTPKVCLHAAPLRCPFASLLRGKVMSGDLPPERTLVLALMPLPPPTTHLPSLKCISISPSDNSN